MRPKLREANAASFFFFVPWRLRQRTYPVFRIVKAPIDVTAPFPVAPSHRARTFFGVRPAAVVITVGAADNENARAILGRGLHRFPFIHHCPRTHRSDRADAARRDSSDA